MSIDAFPKRTDRGLKVRLDRVSLCPSPIALDPRQPLDTKPVVLYHTLYCSSHCETIKMSLTTLNSKRADIAS